MTLTEASIRTIARVLWAVIYGLLSLMGLMISVGGIFHALGYWDIENVVPFFLMINALLFPLAYLGYPLFYFTKFYCPHCKSLLKPEGIENQFIFNCTQCHYNFNTQISYPTMSWGVS